MELMVLDDSVNKLKGVGEKINQRLNKIGIYTIKDLLFHFPFRYENRSKTTAVNELVSGKIQLVEATIINIDVKRLNKKVLTITLEQNEHYIDLVFINYSSAMLNSFSIGAKIRAYGEVKLNNFKLQIFHPEYELSYNQRFKPIKNLLPFYPTTEGLSQFQIRKLISQILQKSVAVNLKENLPTEFNPTKFTLFEAVKILHNLPLEYSDDVMQEKLIEPQIRVIHEEILAYFLSLRKARNIIRKNKAASLSYKTDIKPRFLKTLPFNITNAQARVVTEIEQDLAKNKPMLRLLQGDVGSGKTMVALLSSLVAIDNNKQVALMAPTEILAEQHLNNFTQWLEPFGVETVLLTGKVKGKARQKILEKIENNTRLIVVGTHALFQNDVNFNDLALVIIDEQHRFGVKQRMDLLEKAKPNIAHQLTMTATPIPRTLAMTIYNDLDLSIIDELPQGRKPITTVVMNEDRKKQIIERVKHNCINLKRQVYWVCPLIEESEVLELQDAMTLFEDLKQQLEPIIVGLLHGRMSASEKQQVMSEFKQGKIDVLVATTVIEVGVDVPNASLIIIENAQRFGLSQLHQLRGRVGRGSNESYCVLLYSNPLGKISKERLEAMRTSQDGFYLAEKDLEIRGTGDFIGTKQTGVVSFKIADLERDIVLVEKIQQNAQLLLQNYPQDSDNIINFWQQGYEQYFNS